MREKSTTTSTITYNDNNNNNKNLSIRPGQSVLEIDTHTLLSDFDIQTDHLISARRPDFIIINKKKKKKDNLQNCGLCCPGWLQNKIERKW